MRLLFLFALYIPLYLYSAMSLEEQIGQLFIVGAYPDRADAQKEGLESDPTVYVEEMIQRYHVGGVLFKMRWNPAHLKSLASHFQSLSQSPLFICLDAEWGLSQRMVEGEVFPKNYALGSLDDLDLVYQTGLEIGRQCKEIGVNVNFAPVVDINTNPRNPIINHRSFGSDSAKVADCGVAMMKGLQDGGVLACAKHFPGHGDTSVDSHTGLPLIVHSKERLVNVEFIPFKQLIDKGVDLVMGAHLLMPVIDDSLPTSLSPASMTGILRDEMGFEGLSVTDDLIMGAVMRNYSLERAVVLAFLAGNDLILLSRDVEKGVEAIKNSILKGEIDEKEVARRAEKILEVKRKIAQKSPQLPNPMLKERLYSLLIRQVRGHEHSVRIDAIAQIGGRGDSEILSTGYSSVYCSLEPTELEVASIVRELKAHQQIAVAVFGMKPTMQTNYGISTGALNLIQLLLKEGKDVTVILYGDPEASVLIPEQAAVIGSYDESLESQRASIRLLMDSSR